MIRALFDRATLLYVGGSRWDDIPHDPRLFVQLLLPNFPDRINDRLNAAENGIRPATQAELIGNMPAPILIIEAENLAQLLVTKGTITQTELDNLYI